MQVAQDLDPSTDRVDGHAHVLRQIAIDELVGGSIGQEPDQRLQLVDLLDLRQIADILPNSCSRRSDCQRRLKRASRLRNGSG